MSEFQIEKTSAIFGTLRIIGTKEKPMFCLADVCKALDIKNASSCKSRLRKEGIVTTEGVSPTTNQYGVTTQQITKLIFIDEPNLYKCIFMSRKAKAEKFQDWVTEEVLPSIRRDGGYIATNGSESDEELMARALMVAKAAIKKREERIQQMQADADRQAKAIEQKDGEITQLIHAVGEMQPKASYYDVILASKGTCTVTQIAQDYGLSAKALNTILCNMKIQHKVGSQWILYAKYITNGYVHSKPIDIIRADGRHETKYNTEWTSKGRIFLYGQLKDAGILPLIEKN